MKTIHQLFTEFKQLKNPSDRDYMKLGHDLSTNIVFAPEKERDLLWHFVSSKFPKDKNELITYGAKFYLELQKQENKSVELIDQEHEIILPKEEPIIHKDYENLSEPKEQDEHKKFIAIKINEVRENLIKLDSSLDSLKEIKNPGTSMKVAIDALEKLKEQLGSKYKQPKN